MCYRVGLSSRERQRVTSKARRQQIGRAKFGPGHAGDARQHGAAREGIARTMEFVNDGIKGMNAGDHLGIFANNRAVAVASLLDKLVRVKEVNQELGKKMILSSTNDMAIYF